MELPLALAIVIRDSRGMVNRTDSSRISLALISSFFVALFFPRTERNSFRSAPLRSSRA